MGPHVKGRFEMSDQAGITMNKSVYSLVDESSGCNNLSFGEKDYRNYLNEARLLRLGMWVVEVIQKYFIKMQSKNLRHELRWWAA